MLSLTAHEGTAETLAAQFGALPGTHEEEPLGALVVLGMLVGGGELLVPGALLVAGPLLGALGDPALPPLQVVTTAGGAVAHAHTALAEASTAPMLPEPQPAMTHGAAVA